MLGASFDTPADNRAFAEAQQFNYRLLSDPDRSAGHAYEVVRQPDEKFPDFPRRIAYLIGPDGTIERSYEVSDVEGFAGVVVDDLESLSQP